MNKKEKKSLIPRKTLKEVFAERDAVIKSGLSTAEKLKKLKNITQK